MPHAACPAALALACCLALLTSAPAAPASDPGSSADDAGAAESAEKEPQTTVFERLRVVADPEGVDSLPGAVHVIDRATLEAHDQDDLHRVLRQVPGVNVQEEEGFGLRPNIGIRGSGSERSSKVTLMEDGVLIAPAPYAAPAAYYFPSVGRMETVEVRSGSSTIRHGPFTTGGAVNLISTSIPAETGGSARAAAGSDGFQRLHARLGGSVGRLGWLVEGYQAGSDGFKRLDGGGPTGFDLTDLMVKLRFQSVPEARRLQLVELKLGRTDQTSHETYLGLTDEDFAARPLRRYAGSQEDVIRTDHEQIVLRHFLDLGRRTDLTTTVYRNDFFRNWRKLERAAGAGIAAVLADPQAHEEVLSWIRGEADSPDDALMVRNNRRDYYSQGIQSVLGVELGGGRWSHSLEVGLRYHEDEEDRFQEEDGFRILSGRMVPTSQGAPGSQANRIARARAWALFVQDTIGAGRWTLTPGVRVESIDFARHDFGRADPARAGADLATRRNGVDVLVPGLGVAYEAAPGWTLFAGAHRGFAPPGPGATAETRSETSVNYELGVRQRSGAVRSQLVAFFHDYDNLLGRDTLAAGGEGTGRLFNGGAVDVRGLEAEVSLDPARQRGWGVSLPLSLAYTYTSGHFRSSFETSFASWAPEVEAGDRLPYLPRHQAHLRAGLVLPRGSLHADLAYVSAMRTSPGRGPIPPREGTDAHWTLDLSGKLALFDRIHLVGQVRNLTNEVYAASRRPAGLRPGLPRTVIVGVEVDF